MDLIREEADKYQEFFNFMSNDHNLTLTISEMNDIVREAQSLVKKLNIDDVSKCLHPYKKVVSGDDGMYCTECNKYITTF